MPASDHGDDRDLRSYGRRRGRAPSARQASLLETVLPQIAVDLAQPPPAPIERLFHAPVRESWLEIGFGGAEHLIWQARRHPDVGLIGAEPFLDGVVKALSAIDVERLANVRIHAEDARTLLRWLPEASIGRAFILFPDPWPKARHRKRRLVASALLGSLARVLRPGAELRLATDIADYARTILMAFAAEPRFAWQAEGPADWRRRPDDWPPTRYEQKAIAAGRAPVYLSFRRL